MLIYSPCSLKPSPPLFSCLSLPSRLSTGRTDIAAISSRLLSARRCLYTEMVTTGAIIHGKGDYLLYSEEEHPVASTACGSDPAQLAHCAKLAEARGYDEINSTWVPFRSRAKRYVWRLFDGQCATGRRLCCAMRDVVSIPVTVKPIGIDDQTAMRFCVISSRFPVRANARCLLSMRAAPAFWLKPERNREIPPLDYLRVCSAKRDFPHLTMSINGIKSLEEAKGATCAIWMASWLAVKFIRIRVYWPRWIGRSGADTTDADPVAVIRAMYPILSVNSSRGAYLGHITAICWVVPGIPAQAAVCRYSSECP